MKLDSEVVVQRAGLIEVCRGIRRERAAGTGLAREIDWEAFMKHRLLTLLIVVAAAALASGFKHEPLKPTYSVRAVKGKLLREAPLPEHRLQVGADVAAGSVLRTGWWSSAEIVSPEAGAKFVIGSRSRVRMASEQPGVLLEVEKGRLRAVFDKITEGPSAERIVSTPSAVLAVRGTEYGVAVSKSGDTSVVVFSGVVEVNGLDRTAPPVAVSAGQYCKIARGKAPSDAMPHSMGRSDWDHGRMPHSMGRSDWDHGRMPGAMSGHESGSMMGGRGSGHSSGGGSMGHGG